MANTFRANASAEEIKMTLYRQLMILILTLVILSTLGAIYVTFIHTRSYYTEQLNITAQDTATSLGLSLSSNMSDKATMLSMVNAIFDRGYFSRIEIKNNNDQTIIKRTQKPNYHSLPNWFVYIVNFPSPKRSALIMSGWKQKGTLLVTANPSLAYFDLWNTSKSLIKWFVVLTFLFLSIAYIVTKILFTPLVRVAKQAHEICKNIFHVEAKIPKTKELRLVTEAMNKTVLKLRAIFKEQSIELKDLLKKSTQDSLTGLGNRGLFDSKLKTLINDETSYQPGYLLFLELSDLKAFNEKYGLQKGDLIIKHVADIVTDASQSISCYLKARTTGSNFAIVVLNSNEDEVTRFATKLLTDIKSTIQLDDPTLSVSIGGCAYHYQQHLANLLSNADSALLQAKHQGNFEFCIQTHEQKIQTESLDDWKQCIQNALNNHSIKLNLQQIKNQDQAIFHNEIFSRLITDKGELTAGQFIPIAEKLRIAHKIDLYVIQSVSQLPQNQVPYAINISADTIYDKKHRQSFLNLISRLSHQSIQVEIAESTVNKDLETCAKFIESLHKLGFIVGLDRVGSYFSTILYLSTLKISYIKIDGSFVQILETDETKQRIIKLLKAATESLGITLIGTNIESSIQWETLRKLSVQWGQGKYISEVKNL